MSESPSQPKVIGKCRILSKLGEGGMGVVYKGHHDDLDLDVAVKLLPAHHAQRAGMADRFIREARLAARLKHPGIVGVLDCGHEDNQYYLVMEFVDGESLQDRIDREGALPVAQALTIVQAVAQALGAAQDEVGIIHRDIKPDNIMITRDGKVKVADLGLAKVVEDEQSAAPGMTASGVAMGTPQYMAPEQFANAAGVDHRADIFALGATLYHMLVGKRPFEGDTVYTIMRKIDMEDPEPLPDPIPRAVQTIVMKMLEKKREDRYQTYDEIIDAITAAQALPSGLQTLVGASVTMVEERPASVATESPTAQTDVQSKAVTDQTLAYEALTKPRRPIALLAAGIAVVAALLGLLIWSVSGGIAGPPAVDPLDAEAKSFYEAQSAALARYEFSAVAAAIRETKGKYDKTTHGPRLTAMLHAAEAKALYEKLNKMLADGKYQEVQDAIKADGEKYGKTPLGPKISELAKTAATRLAQQQAKEEAERRRSAYETAMRGGKAHEDNSEWKQADDKYRVALAIAPEEKKSAVQERIEYVQGRIKIEQKIAGIQATVKAGEWIDAWGLIENARKSGIDDPRIGTLAGQVIAALRPRKEITGPLGVKLVLVPGGAFKLGSDSGLKDERPVHDVRLSSYYIGKFEVMRAQFGAFQAQKRTLPEGLARIDQEPVVGVSWDDADRFCKYLSRIDPRRAAYRLPTEAEWEFAARGTAGRAFPWGSGPPTRTRANLKGSADGFEKLAPVGSFPAGATSSGIHDLIGNAAEWCADWYAPYSGESGLNPTGPRTGSQRVVRGGAFAYDARVWSRTTMRVTNLPDTRDRATGFRVVRLLSAQDRKFERLAP